MSLQTMRQKAAHNARRRVWSLAFGDGALRGYEQRIRTYRDKLMTDLVALNGSPTNLTKWFNLYSFDVMGDLAFGASFDMLKTAKNHWMIEMLEKSIAILSLMPPTWLFRFALDIPVLARPWWHFVAFCETRTVQRLKARMAPLYHRMQMSDSMHV